jgi:ABC-2 type transport system permease protein
VLALLARPDAELVRVERRESTPLAELLERLALGTAPPAPRATSARPDAAPAAELPATRSDTRPAALRAVRALARRDRLVQLSHRFQIGLKAGLLGAWIVSLRFMSGLVDTSSPQVARWLSSDYFSYALLGMACLRISQVGLVQMASRLREEQLQGTTEPVFVTGQPPILVLLGGLAWPLAAEIAGLLLIFGLGAAWLGADFSGANVPALVLALVATIASAAVWGILSAAFVIAFKKGDPVALLVNLVTIGLSGVFFPVEMIPGWLQPLSKLLPLTWGLEAVRAAALRGAGFESAEYVGALAGLGVMSAALLPIAWIAHHAALRHALRAGNLGQA